MNTPEDRSSQSGSTARRLTPTLASRAEVCNHIWHLECHEDPGLKEEADAGTKLRWERGDQHEKEMVATLEGCKASGWGEEGVSWRSSKQKTLELLREGPDWIYQPALETERWRGAPDLLRRVDGRSDLGDFSYIPIDIKGHKAVTRKDRMQLAAYSVLLEQVLGYRPSVGGIWLNTGEIEEVDLEKLRPNLEALERTLLEIRDGKVETQPVRCKECRTCPWTTTCRERWEKEGSVCLLFGVSGQEARKLIQKGFETVEDLLQVTTTELADRLGQAEDKVEVLRVRAQSMKEGRPIILEKPVFPQGVPVHFYDIETFGEVVYLHGVIRIQDGDRVAYQFTAKTPEDEARFWYEFLDFLAEDEGTGAVVWTWTTFENDLTKKLWGRHGGNEVGYKVLTQGFKDQEAFIRKHYALPADSYSIKKVAPIFRFKWKAEDAGGLNSESWYGDWLETGNQDLLKKILQYNYDDVKAMEVIDREVRKVELEVR